eukprot:1205097-Rhodomonas_salina.1
MSRVGDIKSKRAKQRERKSEQERASERAKRVAWIERIEGASPAAELGAGLEGAIVVSLRTEQVNLAHSILRQHAQLLSFLSGRAISRAGLRHDLFWRVGYETWLVDAET